MKRCPRGFLLIALGMRERNILPTAAIRPGDRITIKPWWDKVAADSQGMNGSSIERKHRPGVNSPARWMSKAPIAYRWH